MKTINEKAKEIFDAVASVGIKKSHLKLSPLGFCLQIEFVDVDKIKDAKKALRKAGFFSVKSGGKNASNIITGDFYKW